MVRSTGSGNGRSPLAQALQAGYRALRSGDLMAARAHYRDALELAPANRDARLGAAAVAQRQGNAAAAIEHYREVLADHPRDPYARSGLASLESTADPRRIESELKTLLKQDPNAHALRYALGNLYAREQRWAQAQSAYFDAFRAAPGEADYAFNLAVALDQLGKRDAAMKYYDEALELAGDGSASFPIESATRRLESLRQ
jgi:tetratricopeptide (TPR) repeat protein